MEVKAKAKFIRMSPKKIRLVADAVRTLSVAEALDQLKFINKRATGPINKLLKSAITNAEHNFELNKDNLYIKEITVDEGPTLHRWMPRAHGRATPIRKRTSHINLVLAEIKESGKTESKKRVLESPIKLDSRPKEDEGIKVREAKKEAKKESDIESGKTEKGKVVADPRMEGKGKHTKIEGGSHKGFVDKVFRRKSG